MKPTGLHLVDIGSAGRRAVAWFLRNGLAVTATDRDAAKHAMDIVLMTLHQRGRQPEASRFYSGVLYAMSQFPEVPDDQCSVSEYAVGEVDGDVAVERPIGYGYVIPCAQGHERGGALFDEARNLVEQVRTHPAWLVSGPAQ